MQVNESALAHMKNKMSHRLNKLNKRRQRGVTLVELSVAVAVMGMIMAGALVGVPKLMDTVRGTQETKDLQMAVVAVQNAVMAGQLTTGTDAKGLDDLGLMGAMQRTDTNKYLNRFGGLVVVENLPGSGSDAPPVGIKVISKTVPSSQCQKLISSLHPAFATVKVNGTELKRMNTAFDPAKLAAACSSSGDVNNASLAADQKDNQTKADLEFTIGGA
ncbi:MAG: type 4 pilus major pilin [Pandoraea sp.]|nr:type 4 pilus major pilin [Pandoraea sp.]MDR3397881.1 type 4 pilus major pilin [Pandoraea sp.]